MREVWGSIPGLPILLSLVHAVLKGNDVTSKEPETGVLTSVAQLAETNETLAGSLLTSTCS